MAPAGFDRLALHGAVGNLGIQRAARNEGGEGETKSGAMLPSQFGADMEARFGTSFHDVRLHTDSAAHRSAQALNAKAYTLGSDIFFSAGRFDPQSPEGRELLTHELAHVAQQQLAAARPGNGSQRITQTTDPAEAEAKLLARQPRPVAVTASAATIYRDDDAKVPEDFLAEHYPTVASELRNGVQIHTFSLGTPHANWKNDGESRFKMQVAEHMFPALGDGLGNLRNALAPTSDEPILGAVKRGTLDGHSSSAAPAVAFELMPMAKRQIDSSLRRIIPRYLSARNQAAQSSAIVSQPGVEPPLDQIPASARVDFAILAGLLSGTTDFHELDYRAAFPQEARLRGNLGLKAPGNIQFLAAQGMPLWIRVERTDATVEDVAHTVYGESTLSNKIVGAAPLFGIDPGALVEEPYRRQWREAVTKAGLAPMAGLASQGFYPVGSPTDQIPDSMRDEVILNQAKALAPTGATPLEVVQQMRVALGLADQMIAMATKFGVAHLLQGMRTRLDARSKKFATRDAASEAETWGAQAAGQYATLSGATSGLQVACAELKNYGDGEIPPFIRQPLYALATSYIEAGALSEFPGAGAQKLTLAQALNQTYATDVLDGALLFIHDSLKAISSDQAEEMGGSTADLAMQEQGLRLKLASIRNELLTNPKRATELIKELQASVNKLSNRVGVLNALSTIDGLIDALRTHVTNISSTPSGGVGIGIQTVDLRTMDTGDSWKSGAIKPYDDSIASLRQFRTLWAPIAKAAFTGTDEELAQQLRSVAPKQKELNAQLERAMGLAKYAADFDSMFAVYRTFMIGFAIALVTFGVGEIVAGVAIGAGLAEGGAGVFLLSTGAEALTMTTLNAAVMGKEGWEHFGTDFIWNFATAGIMKGVSRLYKGVLGAAAKTGTGAAGEFTLNILAGTLASLAKADFDQRQRTGKGLTDEQARHVTRDSLIQGIALAIGMRVVHDYLPNFKAAGTRFGARIAKINKSRADIRVKAATVGAKPVEEDAQNLSGDDNKLLEEEIRLSDEILATPGISEQDRTTVTEARTDASKATEAAGARNMMMYLEDAGPNQFLCAEGHLNDVKAFYEKPQPPAAVEPPAPGTKTTTPAVKEGPVDKVTHARSLEVTPADGTEPFTVREKVTPGTKPALAVPEAAEAAPKPPEATASKFKTLDDILTPDRKGFSDPDVQQKYAEYVAAKQKKNESFVGPEEWARTFTRGSGQVALEKVLGPDFRAQGDAQHMTELNNFGRPGAFTDAKLNMLWARLTNRMGRFTTGLRNLIKIGIQNGKVNVGYFYNAKGIVAEILAESFKQNVLAERQKTQPGAQQFENAMVSRPGSPEPVQFTDGLIGHPTSKGLEITDRFEIKSGATGGEQAGRQYHKWVESHMVDGTRILLNKRPAVPGETLPPGQERIPPNGGSVYDVYYYKPTKDQRNARPNLRTVTGVSGAGTLHAVMPEGASVLSIDSGDHTAPVKVQDLPATASEINYLTRLILEHVAPVAPALASDAAAGGTK